MKQNSFSDTTRTATATWEWYTLKGYSCDLDWLQSLGKFQLSIGHHVSTVIPACPLLENYHCKINDYFVDKDWKLYIIDLFV